MTTDEMENELRVLRDSLAAVTDELLSAYQMVVARDQIIDEMRRRYRLLLDNGVSADTFAALAGGHSVRVEVVQ